MPNNPIYNKLGEYIVSFQNAENQINELIILLVDADDVYIQILLNDHTFSSRLKIADVIFSRFIDVKLIIESQKTDFHKLIIRLMKQGERRNDYVHSSYCSWLNISGELGFIKENTKLRSSKGLLESNEEELLKISFNNDLEEINQILLEIEKFRIQVVDCLCV